MNNKQKLEYVLKLKKLHEIMVIKNLFLIKKEKAYTKSTKTEYEKEDKKIFIKKTI